MRHASERDVRRKTHGQNFLRSDVLADQLVESAGIRPHDLVVEVGAGSGQLTRHLAARAKHVIAIEVDPAWALKLRNDYHSDRVRVIERDVFTVDMPDVPFRVFANVPFGITTDLMHWLLDDPSTTMYAADLIVQWEVAQKRTTNGHQSLLNITWQPWWEFSLTRRLPAKTFRPIPSVDAGFLRIRRREPPFLSPHDRAAFAGFVRHGYMDRGADLRLTLGAYFTRNQWNRLSIECAFDPCAIAGDLDVWQWVTLFSLAKRVANNGP